MLTKFFEEWNVALKNEVVTHTKTDNKRNIIWQDSVVTFRDTEINIHRKPDGHGGFQAELFVPKTNKFISNKRFVTKAKCAGAILIAMLPGTEKEEIRNMRAEKRAEAVRKKITADRIERLRKARFVKRDFDWFCDRMNRNLQVGECLYDDMLVEIITAFGPELFGYKTALKHLDNKEAPKHIDRMFELVAMILKSAKRNQKGALDLKPVNAAHLFRTLPDASIKLPPGVLYTKDIFRRIDTALEGNTRKLMYVVFVMCDYYEATTGKTRDQIIAAMKERKAKAKERRLRHIEGIEDKGNFTVLSTGGSTLGSMIGDVLDGITFPDK